MRRKKNVRSDVRARVQLAASISDGVIETSARSVDVSQRGLGLESEFLWPAGTHVTVQLRAATGRAAARAVVQRCERGIMGLRLIAHGSGFAQLVEDFLTSAEAVDRIQRYEQFLAEDADTAATITRVAQ